jgi:hypothetical protein
MLGITPRQRKTFQENGSIQHVFEKKAIETLDGHEKFLLPK